MSLLACMFPGYGACQQAASRYQAAKETLLRHTSEDGILSDGSAESLKAHREMWSAATDAVIEILREHPGATPQQIDQGLCGQKIIASGCNPDFSSQHDVIELAPGLYAVAITANTNGGTVVVIGDSKGKSKQLWSVSDASVAHSSDPKDLVGAWKLDRTGIACRDRDSLHKPGSCGPLYAEIGVLPPDGAGRPRFYIDAGYEQLMGATIGKQTSIWRWDGNRATLIWISFYSYMIDQAIGTSFDNDKGILRIGEKGEFRTMFSCGSCIDRPLEQSVLLTKAGVQDLGVRALIPELEVIDELFQRLQTGSPATDLSSREVIRFLKPGIDQAGRTSRKVEPNFFSAGMIGSSIVSLTGTGAEVCIEPDELGTLYFTLIRKADRGYFVQHVRSPKDLGCERGLFLPLPRPSSPAR